MREYPTKKLRTEFKLVGFVSVIPSSQIAKAVSGKPDTGRLYVQFVWRAEEASSNGASSGLTVNQTG